MIIANAYDFFLIHTGPSRAYCRGADAIRKNIFPRSRFPLHLVKSLLRTEIPAERVYLTGPRGVRTVIVHRFRLLILNMKFSMHFYPLLVVVPAQSVSYSLLSFFINHFM